MELTKVMPIQEDGKFRFRVFFRNYEGGETVVEVTAAELNSYSKFTQAVLEKTGRVYCHSICDLKPGYWREELRPKMVKG